MNLCGACLPRAVVRDERHRWDACVGCGVVTDCVIESPEPQTPPVLRRPPPRPTILARLGAALTAPRSVP